VPLSRIALGARESFLVQARAADALGDPPDSRVPASTSGLVWWTLAFVVPLVVGLRLILATALSDDGMIYRALAEDPIDNPLVSNSTNEFYWSFAPRLLVPSIVWLLPVDTRLGFQITTIGGLIAGAVVIAVLVRRLGVGALALLAGPAYVASFLGIYNLWMLFHVDALTVALFSGAILAAYTFRPVVCSALATLVVASKEIGLSLPVAWYAARRGTRPHRRVLAETALVALVPVTVFVLMRYTQLIPHHTWQAWHQYKLGFTTQGHWGYVKPLVQVFVQNYGMLWLLWPLAVLVAPPRWRRLHLFALLLIPLLAGGPWARSSWYLIPFVLPSALLVLTYGRRSFAVAAVVGSIAVAVPLGLRNSAVDEAASNMLLLPGVVLFVVASVPAVRAALADVIRRRGDARSLRPAERASG
jgi:hypothetical protein